MSNNANNAVNANNANNVYGVSGSYAFKIIIHTDTYTYTHLWNRNFAHLAENNLSVTRLVAYCEERVLRQRKIDIL